MYASKSPVLIASISCSVILMISCLRAAKVNVSLKAELRHHETPVTIKLEDELQGAPSTTGLYVESIVYSNFKTCTALKVRYYSKIEANQCNLCRRKFLGFLKPP